eukprot:TRINITY_DN4727_c0_g1_i4.p1 TRINITY_DN4727_c0_g1~~TRINITY_DN4727_c0_g1_i4.p1  ORF type:complete len:114 (-),score=14.13 TRINITY_DN4727_c0_g1_i4:150-491(-)
MEDCKTCLSHLNCVWCENNKVPCLLGNMFGPSDSQHECISGEWKWFHCSVPGPQIISVWIALTYVVLCFFLVCGLLIRCNTLRQKRKDEAMIAEMTRLSPGGGQYNTEFGYSG